jgi:hypothetical protein
MNEKTAGAEPNDDYADNVVAVTKYDYSLPSTKEFRAWHRPRKQFIRHDQWCYFTRLLIDEIQIPDGSLTYFGLPGADLLDLRCFSTSVCEPKALKLKFLGFDKSANPISEDNTDFNVSWDEISKSATIDPLSEVMGEDLRELVNVDSQAWQKTFSVGPYDVINLDLCDGFGKDEPSELSPTYYDVVSRLLTVQARRKTPWLLFLTTRVGRRHVHADTLERLGSLFATNLNECKLFAEACLRRFKIGDTEALAKAGETAFGIQRIFLIGLSKWLLKFSIEQTPPSKLEVKNVLGYRINRGSEAEDMISIAIRFEPVHSSQADSIGLATVKPVHLDECALAEKIVHAIYGLVDVDDVLDSDPKLKAEMIEATWTLLEPARYDRARYLKWAMQ